LQVRILLEEPNAQEASSWALFIASERRSPALPMVKKWLFDQPARKAVTNRLAMKSAE
jgi:hypothetical protein